jgi:hypothetical protein
VLLSALPSWSCCALLPDELRAVTDRDAYAVGSSVEVTFTNGKDRPAPLPGTEPVWQRREGLRWVTQWPRWNGDPALGVDRTVRNGPELAPCEHSERVFRAPPVPSGAYRIQWGAWRTSEFTLGTSE